MEERVSFQTTFLAPLQLSSKTCSHIDEKPQQRLFLPLLSFYMFPFFKFIKLIFFHTTFLQVLDDCIFAFFAVEMVIKMVALGIFGSNCYLGDKWNQLDFVIVMAGLVSICMFCSSPYSKSLSPSSAFYWLYGSTLHVIHRYMDVLFPPQ